MNTDHESLPIFMISLTCEEAPSAQQRHVTSFTLSRALSSFKTTVASVQGKGHSLLYQLLSQSLPVLHQWPKKRKTFEKRKRLRVTHVTPVP